MADFWWVLIACYAALLVVAICRTWWRSRRPAPEPERYYGPCRAGREWWADTCLHDATRYVAIEVQEPDERIRTDLLRLCTYHAILARSVPGFMASTPLVSPALEIPR